MTNQFWVADLTYVATWRGFEDIEFATLDWVSWYNEHRLLEPIGYVPLVEFGQIYWGSQAVPAMVAGVN